MAYIILNDKIIELELQILKIISGNRTVINACTLIYDYSCKIIYDLGSKHEVFDIKCGDEVYKDFIIHEINQRTITGSIEIEFEHIRIAKFPIKGLCDWHEKERFGHGA